jgi:hypothetical protein
MNLEKLFYDFCVAFSGLAADKVLVADSNFVRVPLPYMTFKITTQNIVQSVEDYNQLGAIKTRIMASGLVTFNAYGSTSTHTLDNIIYALHSRAGKKFCQENKVALFTTQGIIDAAALVDTGIEQRHILTVDFRYTFEPIAPEPGQIPLDYYDINAEFNEREFKIIAPEPMP